MLFASRNLSLAVLTLVGPASVHGAAQDLYAITKDGGALLTISTVSNSVSFIGSTGISSPTSLILAPDGFLYSLSQSAGGLLYQIDPATANAAPVGFLWTGGNYIGEGDLTLNSQGVAVGSFADGTSGAWSLFTVNLATGQGALGPVLAGLPGQPHLAGMVSRSDGMLVGTHYRIDTSQWTLVQINPSTGMMSQIAPLLTSVGAAAGMTAIGDTAYLVTGASNGGSNEVWSVNLFTGIHQRIRGLAPAVGGSGISGVAVKPGPDSTEFCFGDSSGVPCPCGNGSPWGARDGCLNSTGSAGRLRSTGFATVAGDSVALIASGLHPSGVGLFFQGRMPQNGGTGLSFGDGILCANTSVIRLAVRASPGGTASFGFGIGTDPLVSASGNIPASGGTRYYQFWYRDAATFCTSSTFNLTNGLRIVWRP